MGDPNASIPTPQPVHYRPMFGAFGRALRGELRHLRLAGRRSRTGSAAGSACSRPLAGGPRDARIGKKPTWCERRHAAHRGRPRDLRGPRRRRAADLRARRGAAAWRSATSCSEPMRRAVAPPVLAGRWPWPSRAPARVTLAFDDRHRRRLVLRDDAAEPFLLDLPRAAVLRRRRRARAGGRRLSCASARRRRSCSRSSAARRPHAARARLAPRQPPHCRSQVLADGRLRIRADHVIDATCCGPGRGGTDVTRAVPPGRRRATAAHETAISRHASP